MKSKYDLMKAVALHTGTHTGVAWLEFSRNDKVETFDLMDIKSNKEEEYDFYRRAAFKHGKMLWLERRA